MKTRKTLVTKINQDITLMNEAQIEAVKAMWKASYEPVDLKVDFEVVIEDDETKAEDALDLYQYIQKEFLSPEQAKEKPLSVEQALAELGRLVDKFGDFFKNDGKQ